MPEQLALEKTNEPAIAPMQMIQRALEAAIQKGEGLEVVDRILAHQRAMIEYQDKVDLNAALRRIQDELKKIPKRGENRETNSKFAKEEDIDDALEGLLKRERMTLSFEPRISERPECVVIVGILSLNGAFTKEYPLEMPADGKGAKGGGVMSRTHATGSAITYGKRYLKNMIFDLRFTDDDGNRASKGGGALDDKQHIVLLEAIQNARTVAEVTAAYIKAIKAAGAVGDQNSIAVFEREANKRKKELA